LRNFGGRLRRRLQDIFCKDSPRMEVVLQKTIDRGHITKDPTVGKIGGNPRG
jgi:hypothetical protein